MPDDIGKLISVAHSNNAEELVFLPGLDEIFYFPSPRAGDPNINGRELATDERVL